MGYTPEELQQIVRQSAGVYGVDSGVLSRIAELESGWRPSVMNDWDSNAAKGTPSGGLMQFIKPTFQSYAAQAKAANPNAWRGVRMDWMDPRAQSLAAAWAIKNGKGSAWATYQKALGGKPAPVKSVPSQQGAAEVAQTGLTGRQSANIGKAFSSDVLRRLVLRSAAERFGTTTNTNGNSSNGSSSGGGPGFKWGKDTLSSLQKLAARYGLPITSANDGKHAEGSLHYSNRAVDLGLTPGWQKLAAYARKHPGEFEEFLGPMGWHIFDGKIFKGAYKDHDDHLHVAR